MTLASPLTPDHARQLEALVETLSPDEALWISGYLAGLTRRQAPKPASGAAPLTILFGSETGHAAALAQRMGERAAELGLPVRVVDMADFQPPEMKAVRRLAILTSTYGDGDPPDPAAGFYEFLHSRKAPRLDGIPFAVLGLGDSTYERFCQTAKDFDQRLEELGARRIQPRLDCDVDYAEPALAWIEAALPAFSTGAPTTPRAAPAKAAQEEQGPFLAPIIETLVLNGRGSTKETRHMEFSLEGSELSYEPGDSLSVMAENDPALVAELMTGLGLSGDLLADELTRGYEITTLTPRFLALYAEAAGAEKLRSMRRPDLMEYMAGRQIIDVVSEFPAPGLDGPTVLSMLRKLQPRLYSLASSLSAYPDEAHITVAVVRYDSHGRRRQGLASGYLAERRGLDDTVPVTIARNPNFRLPNDGAAPIIMVGAGTGVAPYRAFLQQREAEGAKGRNWLFFGDRQFRTDFLYQLEWQRLLRDGRLTRMDVAFSRDQDQKIYVQHRLLEHAKEIYGWLEDGAHLYVCGDATKLAPDVHAALTTILEGKMGADDAEDALKRLQREKRYQRDVY